VLRGGLGPWELFFAGLPCPPPFHRAFVLQGWLLNESGQALGTWLMAPDVGSATNSLSLPSTKNLSGSGGHVLHNAIWHECRRVIFLHSGEKA